MILVDLTRSRNRFLSVYVKTIAYNAYDNHFIYKNDCPFNTMFFLLKSWTVIALNHIRTSIMFIHFNHIKYIYICTSIYVKNKNLDSEKISLPASSSHVSCNTSPNNTCQVSTRVRHVWRHLKTRVKSLDLKETLDTAGCCRQQADCCRECCRH